MNCRGPTKSNTNQPGSTYDEYISTYKKKSFRDMIHTFAEQPSSRELQRQGGGAPCARLRGGFRTAADRRTRNVTAVKGGRRRHGTGKTTGNNAAKTGGKGPAMSYQAGSET
ncbi:hypothetical protein [Oryza sativa Japonica Group]|uniref:Uncharacterized protein n=1 Tax=Oryza sativa subsp. japonica TaxID=39947 RepID=Q5QNK6_ORYSJ|nr:hypothetical protein [Oryza sativa Japonica Group]